jgi:hypothetical protein
MAVAQTKSPNTPGAAGTRRLESSPDLIS